MVSRNILLFHPFRSEVDTTIIIDKAIKDGKHIILPRVDNDKLSLYYVENPESQLKPGYMGIMEPISSTCSKAHPDKIDLALIPGVCFDKKKNRLGYGGGFYDKLIPELPTGIKKISLCFDFQVLDKIPSAVHDRKVDKIITEKKIYFKNIAILIAAYNEEKYVEIVLRDCIKTGLDVIAVNDGSTDKTAEIIRSVKSASKEKVPGIYLLEHGVNRGKGEALKTGFSFALKNNYSGVITLDADGQHNVNEVLDFVNKVDEENPDIIVGSRFKNTKNMPFIRLATNVFTSWLISIIASKKIDDVQSGFRYIGERVLKNIKLETGNFDTEPEILLKASWMNYKIINIPVSTIYHKDFVSHVNPVKDTVKFFRMVLKSIVWKIKFKHLYTRP